LNYRLGQNTVSLPDLYFTRSHPGLFYSAHNASNIVLPRTITFYQESQYEVLNMSPYQDELKQKVGPSALVEDMARYQEVKDSLWELTEGG
ncbi:MAG: hypothetical protein AAFO91_17320, partial [Bacteroidota bacterium]